MDKTPKTLLSLTKEEREKLEQLATRSGTTWTGWVRQRIYAEWNQLFKTKGGDKDN